MNLVPHDIPPPPQNLFWPEIHKPEAGNRKPGSRTTLAKRTGAGPFLLASEDFSYFVEQGGPGFYFSLGGADPEKFAEAKASGVSLPSNHSPLFAPDVDPALHTAIEAEVAVLRNLLSGSAEELKKSITTHSSP
jgi:metal-dependent amidase/aminoacylase/carboxypeptidase family protein